MTALAARAHADLTTQWSTRLTLGGGAYVSEAHVDPWPLFEMGLRADMLLGATNPDEVRVGPAIDIRTEDFRTFELCGALEVFLPVGSGLGFTVTGGGGWGARPQGRDGALLLTQLAFGFRPYNYFSIYGYAANVYLGSRVQLQEPRVWEITLGFEIDTEILFVIPVLYLYTLLRGGDPDEAR